MMHKSQCTAARIALACAFLAAGLAGCGGGGSSAGPAINPSIPRSSNVVVLPAGTVVTPSGNGGLNNVGLAGGNLPTLAAGVVVASGPLAGAPNGMLRQVDSVSGSSFTSHPVSLEDVFLRAQLQVHQQLDSSNLTSRSVRPGVRVAVGANSRGGGGPVVVSLDTVLSGTGATAVTLSGTASITASMDVSINIDANGVASLSVVPTVTSQVQAKLNSTESASGLNASVLIAQLTTIKPIVEYLGPVPVVFTPIIDVYAKLNGAAKPGLAFTYSGNSSVGAGVQYVRGGGWTAVPSFSHSADKLVQTNNPYAAFTGSATPYQPDMTIELYGVPIATANYSAAALNYTFTRPTPPPGTNLVVDAAFMGSIAATGSPIGVEVPAISFNSTINTSFHLFNQFLPDNGQVLVGIQ
ncbi:MAG: hypothetical protein KGJ62_08680 [Armatimonadetes bacterium]|nr:hypothetical protein [Armatimonadota bacterium]MDE2205032.1 hypothetical protein [Armatimonadota bacterium]